MAFQLHLMAPEALRGRMRGSLHAKALAADWSAAGKAMSLLSKHVNKSLERAKALQGREPTCLTLSRQYGALVLLFGRSELLKAFCKEYQPPAK